MSQIRPAATSHTLHLPYNISKLRLKGLGYQHLHYDSNSFFSLNFIHHIPDGRAHYRRREPCHSCQHLRECPSFIYRPGPLYSAANRKARLLAAKVLIEQERFRLYGHYIGILRSKNGLLLRKLPAQSQDLVPIVVKEVERLLSDADNLLSKCGIAIESDKSPLPNPLPPAGEPRDTSATTSTYTGTINPTAPSHQATVSTTELKLKYARKLISVWTDEKKVGELHQHLRELNDALWGTLSTHHLVIMDRAMPSFVLPDLNDVLTLAEIRENARDAPSPRIIGDCAEMRQDIMVPTLEMQSSEAWKRI
jgi:hypothetical protein